MIGRRSRLLRRLSVESLECRNLLSAGDFLGIVENPSSTLQPLSEAGSAVSIDDGFLAVGAPWDDGDGKSDIGKIHLYDETTGSLLRSLQSQFPTSGGRFGHAVDVAGQQIVAGSPFSDFGEIDAGLVEVFDRDTGTPLLTVLNPEPSAVDQFGWAVAAEGDFLVVGAFLDDLNGFDTGTAYVFDIDTGELLHTLSSPSASPSDYFGFSVAISDGVVAVGSRRSDVGATDDGAVFLFDAGEGSFLREIANPTPQSFDGFGRAVAISGDVLVVGADHDNTGAPGAGAAYLYSVSSGTLLHTLPNPTPNFVDFFGSAVAVSGDHVVVGAIRADDAILDGGAAYLFSVGSGEVLATWTSPNPNELDVFGGAVAIDGDTAVIGSYWDDTSGTDAGAAYTFDANSRAQVFSLPNPSLGAFNYFGFSVAVSGNLVAVGAPFEDEGNVTDVGVVYLVDAISGDVQRTIYNPEPAASDAFGYSVAMHADLLVVGAYRADDGATDSGIAYVFDALTGDLLSTLHNPSPEPQDFFGYSIDVADGQVVVGAYRKDGNDGEMTDVGTAYLFDAYSGQLIALIENPDPTAFDFFGHTVAISESHIAIGAYQDDAGGFNVGSAYLFDRLETSSVRQIVNPEPNASDQFGYSVALWGSVVAIGAPRKDAGDFDAGAVYLYHAGTGVPIHALTDASPKVSGNFGGAISMSDNLLVVGSHRRDFPSFASAGAVDLFDATSGQLLRQLSNPEPMANDFFGWAVATDSNITVVGSPLVDGATTDRGAIALFASRPNVAPNVLAGGPYLGFEGEVVNFQALGISDDRDAFADLLIEWDFDYDGNEFDVDAVGSSPTAEFGAAFSSRTIAVRVVDLHGAVSIATTTLEVQESVPILTVENAIAVAEESKVASNSGALVSPEGGFSLSASVGEVAVDEAGSWNWSFVTTDGPDETQTVIITATDGDGGISSVEFDLQVENVAPVLLPAVNTLSVLQGDDAIVMGTVTDVGDDTIGSLIADIGELIYDGGEVWSWSLPTIGISDSPTVTLIASDSDGAETSARIDVVVTRLVSNDAMVTLDGTSQAQASGRYSLIEGQDPLFTASVGVVTANPDGTWIWAYAADHGPIDSQTVTISADYGIDIVSSVQFELIVSNLAPTVAIDAPVVVVGEGDVAEVQGSYTDADGDAVVLEATLGQIVNNGDGTWTWFFEPAAGQAAVEVVTVTVTDSDGASASTEFQLELVNAAPTLQVATQAVSFLPTELATNSGDFNDPGGDPVTLSASLGSVLDLGEGRWEWSYVPRSASLQDTVTIHATDDEGATRSISFFLHVGRIAVDESIVQADEGESAANSGRYSVPESGEVQLASSVGTILDEGDGIWSWSFGTSDGPDESQVVVVTVTYEDQSSVTAEFDLEVSNLAPQLAVDEETVDTYLVADASNTGFYSDAGQDTVQLTASIGVLTGNADGTWSWSVGENELLESQAILISAIDGDDATTTVSFQLNILPWIDGDADMLSFDEGSVASTQGSYYTGQPVTLSASIGAVLDDGDGIWSWTHPAAQSHDDSLPVKIVADYGNGAVHVHEFLLSVNNLAPELSVAEATVLVRDGALASNVGTYSDVDSVTLSASIGVVADLGGGMWSWSLPTMDGPDDSQTVTIVATDEDGARNEVSFELVDEDADAGPINLDFQPDGVTDVRDLDLIVGAIVGQISESPLDLNGDQTIDVRDLEFWLSTAAIQSGFAEPYLPGDANLDGVVNSGDLNAMALNWQQDAASWSGGDFNADGFIDASDLNTLALNWQNSIAALPPESATLPSLGTGPEAETVARDRALRVMWGSEPVGSRIATKTVPLRVRQVPSYRELSRRESGRPDLGRQELNRAMRDDKAHSHPSRIAAAWRRAN